MSGVEMKSYIENSERFFRKKIDGRIPIKDSKHGTLGSVTIRSIVAFSSIQMKLLKT
jgi:hypothetical protein